MSDTTVARGTLFLYTAPFFVALQKGYYRDEGLDVSIDVGAGSVASITRIASGVYQMGLGDISSLIEFQAAQSGTPLVQAVYQYYNRAPFVIIGRKDRGITSDFASLKGKRVAAAAVEATRRAWPMVARKLRLKDNFFQWSTTDFASRDNVVVRGDVDGATYFHDSAVSLFARMKLDELSILQYQQAGVNLYGNAILASNAMTTQNPAAVAGFLRATNRAIQESMADPAAAMRACTSRIATSSSIGSWVASLLVRSSTSRGAPVRGSTARERFNCGRLCAISSTGRSTCAIAR